jgi:streptomycin 6-kinase
VRVRVPDGLEWWAGEPGGAAWLARLPRLAEECAEMWGVALGPPFEPALIAFVAPAEFADGTRAVLKLNFPEPESEHEADALDCWQGKGAVRLLCADPGRRALLVERCEPGTQLWQVSDDVEASRIAAGVLRRLWRPAPARFRRLADEAARWARELPARYEALGEPFERELLDTALAALQELAPTQGEMVVCHQDLHGGNVLRAERDDWLAIDPKPLAGERAFDAASLLRDRRWELGLSGAPARIRRRLDLLAAELDLDRERMRGWGVAHALAWGVSDRRVEPEMVESARLLASCG